jgi:hypothetical protein
MASANLRKVKLSRIIIIENSEELRHSLNLRYQSGVLRVGEAQHEVLMKALDVARLLNFRA